MRGAVYSELLMPVLTCVLLGKCMQCPLLSVTSPFSEKKETNKNSRLQHVIACYGHQATGILGNFAI